ncbi:hypothetical protein Tsubulata_003465 [Turnera subulata]|uniref:Alpha/beta hydrolase fold-3 domain-containing protein n=1 Tax=Turnera subulata TaxID=218843 RepID=A0A9Q0G7T3_9ROSI|nr:hypothetical protein Tsubulata_003465 [Turnera subulata]
MECTLVAPPLQVNNSEIAHEFRFFRAYKDGRVEVFYQTQKLPPSTDPNTGVQSKDVTISTEPNHLTARVFLPKIQDPTQKLPILYYIHGGGFCAESAFSPIFHNHLMTLVAEANVIAVSIEYGLFPERPLPGCYEDSWAGLQWIASHANGNGPDPWLNQHGDFSRFFMGGDSGGANVSNYLAVRVASEGLAMKILGIVMVHPFFGGMEDDAMWMYMNPSNTGPKDPKLKPPLEDLAKLACDRILIFFAEKDHLREVGGAYYEDLKNSGFKGSVEVVEHEGEAHDFHLFNPTTEKAADLVKKFAAFLNRK